MKIGNLKIVAVVVALLGAALWLQTSRLASANEARGALEAQIDEVVQANENQEFVIDELDAAMKQLSASFNREKERADAAVQGLVQSQQELENQKDEFAKNLAAQVRPRLTEKERICADEPVPAAYFDSMPGSTETH